MWHYKCIVNSPGPAPAYLVLYGNNRLIKRPGLIQQKFKNPLVFFFKNSSTQLFQASIFVETPTEITTNYNN